MKEGRKIVGEAKGGEGREKEVEVVEQGSLGRTDLWE